MPTPVPTHAPTTAAHTAAAFVNDPAWDQLIPLAAGAALNLLVAVIIVRFIYYPVTRDRSYVFSFLAFNTVIFFVLAMLTSVELSMSIGFGLFAIFSVLRYRTDTMPIREMTYLFIVIALPVMNSVMVSSGAYERILFANAVIVAVVFALEKQWGFRFQGRKLVMYERMDLIPPARRADLTADLVARTGLAITRIDVGVIDYLRDTAELTIYYDETDKPAEPHTPDPYNLLIESKPALPSAENHAHGPTIRT